MRTFESSQTSSKASVRSLVRLIRPAQWVKNIFVFAGLLFNRSLNDAAMVATVLLAFVGFCLVASAVYVINDMADREEDRAHATKRLRPIASGSVSVRQAAWSAVALLISGLAFGYAASEGVLGILAIYLVLNVAYSFGLKRVVILDVFIIAAGFLLRIMAGTIGVGMAPSEWLFFCSLCLTLFLGFGKRRAELLGRTNGVHQDEGGRSVLREYSPVLLDSMMAAVAACTIVTYGLFTMSEHTVQQHGTTALVYTLPFVMYAMFRYMYMLHGRGKGDDPSEDLIRDPHVLISAALWLLATYLIMR